MIRILKASLALLCIVALPTIVQAEVSKETLDSISTPTLRFLDGAPLHKIADQVYDFLVKLPAVDASLTGQPAASLKGLFDGAHSVGEVEAQQVEILISA